MDLDLNRPSAAWRAWRLSSNYDWVVYMVGTYHCGQSACVHEPVNESECVSGLRTRIPTAFVITTPPYFRKSGSMMNDCRRQRLLTRLSKPFRCPRSDVHLLPRTSTSMPSLVYGVPIPVTYVIPTLQTAQAVGYCRSGSQFSINGVRRAMKFDSELLAIPPLYVAYLQPPI